MSTEQKFKKGDRVTIDGIKGIHIFIEYFMGEVAATVFRPDGNPTAYHAYNLKHAEPQTKEDYNRDCLKKINK